MARLAVPRSRLFLEKVGPTSALRHNLLAEHAFQRKTPGTLVTGVSVNPWRKSFPLLPRSAPRTGPEVEPQRLIGATDQQRNVRCFLSEMIKEQGGDDKCPCIQIRNVRGSQCCESGAVAGQITCSERRPIGIVMWRSWRLSSFPPRSRKWRPGSLCWSQAVLESKRRLGQFFSFLFSHRN